MLLRIALPVLLVLFGLTLSFGAEAQRSGKIYRIGVLHPGFSKSNSTPAFVRGLRDLGYVEGRNIRIVYRFAESRKERLPELAADLVRQNVDVIFVCCQPAVDAARQATRTIPIVVGVTANWVGQGLAQSLRRPGGNITGLTSIYPGLTGKMLQVFKETVPKMSRVAVLHINRGTHRKYLSEAREVAKKLGLTLAPVGVSSPKDFPSAFRKIQQARVDGLLVLRGGLTHRHKHLTTAFALKAGLPTIYGHRQEAEAGGMLAYGTDVRALFREAARYVDKILKGANPAELPIQRPTRFDFVVNLKTAKALKIEVPGLILMQATKVIE